MKKGLSIVGSDCEAVRHFCATWLFELVESKGAYREKIIVQVKGGTGAKNIRDLLIGTVGNQKAVAGVLITLDRPTKPMRDEAATACCEARLWQKDYPKIQIVTITGLLDGTETINAPPPLNPFAMAAGETNEHKQTEML